jgi:hypothetical protein
MTRNRTAATLILLLTAAAPAAAGAATHPVPLTRQAPAWLAPSGRASSTGSRGPAAGGAPTTSTGAGLPATGSDLLTETGAALGLVGVGVALRAGFRGRRT